VLRTGLVVAGMSLALLLLLEAGYRGYEKLFPAQDSLAAAAPSAREPWFRAWAEARARHVSGPFVDPDPYRGWWIRPGRHEGLLVVEPSGYRRTVQAPRGEGAARRRVFMFGGSAMWGFTARDPATIPSFVAAQLAAAGVGSVEVENKAQSSYNLTQGLATLALELRRGERPAAAVFLDGVNEVGIVATGEQPGDIYGERRWRERFQPPGARDVLPWLGAKLHLVAALRSFLGGEPEPPRVDVAAACRTIAEHYANQVRIAESLGREFGFQVHFFWQPTLAMSRKAPGPWESALLAERGLAQRIIEITRACARETETRLAKRLGSTFHSLHAIFDHAQGDVFVDHYGHVVEPSNATIAAAITQRLLPILK